MTTANTDIWTPDIMLYNRLVAIRFSETFRLVSLLGFKACGLIDNVIFKLHPCWWRIPRETKVFFFSQHIDYSCEILPFSVPIPQCIGISEITWYWPLTRKPYRTLLDLAIEEVPVTNIYRITKKLKWDECFLPCSPI